MLVINWFKGKSIRVRSIEKLKYQNRWGAAMRVLIIGGDAAGMSAASKLKRTQPDCEIIVFEKGNYLSYAACGLPYFISDPKIEPDSLVQRTKEEFEATGIKPKLQHEVTKILPNDRKVIVRDAASDKEFECGYDKLLITCGARPIVPPLPGVNLNGVFNVKTIDDGILIKDKLSHADIKDITIIGGGYIGVEIAEALSASGRRIRIIEMADRLLLPFDYEVADITHKELIRLGVEVKVNEKMEAVIGSDHVEKVSTDKGTYATDVVIMAIGVRPATEFIRGSGINLANNGAVIVDREMRTNLPDIYAAGDCAEVYNSAKGQNSYIALATTANKCGRIAGENLSGKHVEFAGTMGSSALKVGDIEIARTGLSENEAKDLKLDYRTVSVGTPNLPHYYHGSTSIWFKVIYEKGTRRILGVQGSGKQGVVLRIDVFACAIANKMTTEELGMLDLCYAPPFSTVWDAINIAANAAK